MSNFNRKNGIENVFIHIWVFYAIAYICSGMSGLPDKYPFVRSIYAVVANVTIIALLMLLLIVKKYSLFSFLLEILLVFLVFVVEIFRVDRGWLISILFLVNASGINLKRLMKIDLKLKIILLVALLLLCVFGITENRIFIVGSVYKNSLGFHNPNMLAFYVVTIMIEWLCLHYGAIKKYQYLTLLALGYIVNVVSAARTSLYTFFIVLVFYIFADFAPRIFYLSITKVMIGLLTPVLAVLSFFLSYLYLCGNDVAFMLDKITTGRLRYAAYALSKYGVGLIGKPFNTSADLMLDNAYIYGAICYGMIFLVLLCLMYSGLFIKLIRHRKINIMLLGVFFVVSGLGEHMMYSAIYNMSMLYLLNDDV